MEDEWLIADSTCAALREAGFEIVGPAPSPEDALRRIAAEPPDAATLDIRLSDDKNFAVAEELARRAIPFVFISGYTEMDLPAGFRARPFLTKPVPEAEVVKAVTGLLA
jgi:CheY-like chemotaxis protein